jgi:hypothetical protein
MTNISKKQSKPLRWTIELACYEFGINSRTLSTRLRLAGITPGKDGMYSTKEIDAAKNGDIQGERLRKEKGLADKLEIQNRKELGELIEVDVVDEMWEVNDLNLKEQLIRLPTVFESRHHAGMETTECRTILDSLVDEVCKEISKEKPKRKRG